MGYRYSYHYLYKTHKRTRHRMQNSLSLLYLNYKGTESTKLSLWHGILGRHVGKISRQFQRLVQLSDASFVYITFLIVFIICFFNIGLLLNNNLGNDNDNGGIKESRDFTAPNELLKMTAMGVKTYNRPECLQEFIKSVRTFAPYLPVLVADDSSSDVQSYWHTGVQADIILRLPTDSGVGYGRNRIVEAIHKAGYKYLIMADDDFKLTSGETIPMMAKYLHETGADVLAATRCDHNMENCQRSKGLLMIQNHTLTVLPNVTSYANYPNAPSCYRSDLVQQFFMARTERLLSVHWDDVLKNNDHYDFLLAAKTNNLSLVTCSDVFIFHEKSCENRSIHGKAYTKTRERRWYDLLKYIMRKWNLNTIHDEVGKTLIIDKNGSGRAFLPSLNKYSIKAEETRLYSESVVHAANCEVAGWTWLRVIYDKQTWVIKKTVNPCSYIISGSLHVEYDRYKTFKNNQFVTRYQMYMYNETCPFAESLWRVRHHGHYDMSRHVYYVTAVANDNSYLKRLLHVLNNDKDKNHLTLVVVLMDATSQQIVEVNAKNVDYDVIIVDQGPPFSRSIGLKAGFNKAISLAQERGQKNAVGFSIDTSIIAPDNFTERIKLYTICGSSAFAPIVYKCMSCLSGDLSNQTDGFWVYTGFGMVGLCLTDYVAIGGWSAVWGYRWGSEDVDIMDRINNYLPFVFRTKEEGYIYVRNPSVKDKNPAYYTKRNIYPKPLPGSSLTTQATNNVINLRLQKFIISQIPELNNKSWQVVSVKKTYKDQGRGLVYHVVLSNGNQYYWSFIQSSLSPLL